MAARRVISICGPSGSGKSTLAVALGAHRAARVPCDSYLVDADPGGPGWVGFRWDWERLAADLEGPDGEPFQAPDVDFTALRRRGERGGPTVTRRPVMVLDAMRPYPAADTLVWLDVPPGKRLRRVRERDRRWGSHVADRWAAQETGSLSAPDGTALRLDGRRPVAELVAELVGIMGDADGTGWLVTTTRRSHSGSGRSPEPERGDTVP